MMNWRDSQSTSRERGLAKFDAAEAERWAISLTRGIEDTYIADLARVLQLHDGMSILDVGAGTGIMCQILSRMAEVSLTALEPVPAMLAKLKSNADLQRVEAVEGFCDAAEDRRHFDAARFDVIISRQLTNGLYDPLTAFRNWHYWLKPGGAVVVIDGLLDRSAWAGKWEVEIDTFPLSASQSTALTPYLLESVGFAVVTVERMAAINARSSLKTIRYVVVAKKTVGAIEAP